MLSHEPRQQFAKAQLVEVICQLRFPSILTIETELPAQFQEAIRGTFPRYTARKEAPAPKITGTPGNMSLENQAPTTNYFFISEDGRWRVNLTSTFISLTCGGYTTWEEFAKMLDLPLAAFIRLYHPAFFERVGLRYLNAFSRRALGLENVPFRELIAPCYLGALALEEVAETSTNRSSYDLEMRLQGGCGLKLHAGPGMVQRPGQPKDNEVRFIFDMDLYMGGKLPVNLSAGSLNILHQQADSLFLGAITDTLKAAMEPVRFL